MSSSENLEQRIQLIMDSQDTNIVDDLCHHNRGHPTKYDTFGRSAKNTLIMLLKHQWMTGDMVNIPI